MSIINRAIYLGFLIILSALLIAFCGEKKPNEPVNMDTSAIIHVVPGQRSSFERYLNREKKSFSITEGEYLVSGIMSSSDITILIDGYYLYENFPRGKIPPIEVIGREGWCCYGSVDMPVSDYIEFRYGVGSSEEIAKALNEGVFGYDSNENPCLTKRSNVSVGDNGLNIEVCRSDIDRFSQPGFYDLCIDIVLPGKDYSAADHILSNYGQDPAIASLIRENVQYSPVEGC